MSLARSVAAPADMLDIATGVHLVKDMVSMFGLALLGFKWLTRDVPSSELSVLASRAHWRCAAEYKTSVISNKPSLPRPKWKITHHDPHTLGRRDTLHIPRLDRLLRPDCRSCQILITDSLRHCSQRQAILTCTHCSQLLHQVPRLHHSRLATPFQPHHFRNPSPPRR